MASERVPIEDSLGVNLALYCDYFRDRRLGQNEERIGCSSESVIRIVNVILPTYRLRMTVVGLRRKVFKPASVAERGP